VPLAFDPQLAAIPVIGLIAGLVLLGRGLLAYRTAGRFGDISSSTIRSIAAGEVRVSGTIEAAELTLTSPIQGRPCVYYRARIYESGDREERTVFEEERAAGFRIRDSSGDLRVFPRCARFDVPTGYREGTGLLGDEPIGIDLRLGLFDPSARRRTYEEARLEVGDAVTAIGTVLPFELLPDPAGADEEGGSGVSSTDPEVAADLAEARAAGILAADPAAAWGNAAIAGFGIGAPVRPPALDPAGDPLPIASKAAAEAAERTFDIAPDAFVLAAGPDSPLLIAAGSPGAIEARGQGRVLLGLGGAVLAIGSAVGLAVVLGNSAR
jgi:hypothetical protein